MRQCKKCKIEKSDEDFYFRRSVCKRCFGGLNHDPIKREFKTSRKTHEQKKNERYWYNVRWKFNLSKDEVLLLFQTQNYLCAICGCLLPNPPNRNFHIDHCHTTNQVRGILCGGCNRGLGAFRDSKEFLKRATNYLDEHTGDN